MAGARRRSGERGNEAVVNWLSRREAGGEGRGAVGATLSFPNEMASQSIGDLET